MKIEGTHIFAASKSLVWSLLHDPKIIYAAIPGGNKLDQISPTQFTAQLQIPDGPFQGEYKGSLQLTDVVPQESLTLGLRGEGPEGLVWGDGQIDLVEEDGHTFLHYSGELVVSGPTVTSSPRLLKTTANALIRQYLETVDRYIEIQTGVYTTETTARSTLHRTSTIDMRERIEEIRQNRRTTFIVLILALITFLMTIGAVAIGFIIIRWTMRLFRQYVNHVIREEQQTQISEQI